MKIVGNTDDAHPFPNESSSIPFPPVQPTSVARWPWPPPNNLKKIIKNRPYKKIICGEKLMAVKVAVSGNKVL